MGSETLARSHGVVVQHPEGAEMHPAGIVIVCKTERMVSLQPTVVGITARLGAVNHLVHKQDFLILNFNGPGEQTPRQPRLRAAHYEIRKYDYTFRKTFFL